VKLSLKSDVGERSTSTLFASSIGAINIKSLQKAYAGRLFKPEKLVFKNLHVQIPSGKVTSFIGPSGSGKSTLANILVGKDTDWSGYCDGLDNACQGVRLDHLFHQSYDDNKSPSQLIGYCNEFEHFSTLSDTCMSNGFDLYTKTPMNRLLETHRKIFEITYGICKTLSSADSDITSNLVLVLDEYLDKDVPSVRKKVKKFLDDLITQKSLKIYPIIVTHSKGVMVDCSDHVIALYKGQLYSQGTPDKVQFPPLMTWLP